MPDDTVLDAGGRFEWERSVDCPGCHNRLRLTAGPGA